MLPCRANPATAGASRFPRTQGTPITFLQPESAQGQAYIKLAERVWDGLPELVDPIFRDAKKFGS